MITAEDFLRDVQRIKADGELRYVALEFALTGLAMIAQQLEVINKQLGNIIENMDVLINP